jgi:hypothetical protein
VAGQSAQAWLPDGVENFKAKAHAEKGARWVESEMDRRVFVSAAETEQTPLEALLERYEREVLPAKKSQADVRSRIAVINRLIGFYSAATLTPKVLAAFRAARAGTSSSMPTSLSLPTTSCKACGCSRTV